MESEIAAEIPEYGAPSLHVDETGNVLNRKDELLTGNLSDNENSNSSTFLHVVAPGQIVPSQDTKAIDTGYSETEVKDSNGYSTVPQGSEPMDYLEEPDILKQSEMNQEHILSEDSTRGFEKFTSPMDITGIISESKKHEDAVKTFHWSPTGLKEQITELPTPNTFDQVVSYKNEENDDNRITVAKQVPFATTVSYTSSNYVDQSETNSFQEENKTLTSILKKEDNQEKKNTTVHFPENIVSLKFYDLSEDEDSDNDTVILSDPEEDDDLRIQEVPLNTYGDYINNHCFPSINFIPQFSFLPVLKIANHQLYDNIDDEEDQILAIMEDDDGREKQHLANVNDLTTDVIYHEESVSEHNDDQLTSKDVKNVAENPEDAIEIIELQTLKNGIEGLEDDLDVKADKPMKTGSESLVVKESVSTEEMINARIESPMVIAIATTCAINEADNKDVVTESNALPQDVLKATSTNSVVLAKETKSNESSDSGTDVTQNSSRTFNGNCGNKFLWRGLRTLKSMIVDEDFEVPPVPSLNNDILYRSGFIKEEITFPKEALIDVGSRELNILAALESESAVPKHHQEEFQLEKYAIHSFISCPDHMSNFDETWKSTDFPNKMQKVENETHNSGLKDDHLKSGIADVGQRRTDFFDHDGTKPHHTTTFKDDNQGQGVTRKYSKECDISTEKLPADDSHHLTPQTVPDMDIQDQFKAQAVRDSSRAVPSAVDDVMDTTNVSLHFTDYPLQSHKVSLPCEGQDQQTNCSNFKLEEEENKSINHTSVFKPNSGFPHSQTPFLAKQGKRKLRVGLSKSTRVKPLHPYWSKERIK